MGARAKSAGVLALCLLLSVCVAAVGARAAEAAGNNLGLFVMNYEYDDPAFRDVNTGPGYLARYGDLSGNFARLVRKENITRAQFLEAIDEAFSESAVDDVLYLYYGGHGWHKRSVNEDGSLVQGRVLESFISFTDSHAPLSTMMSPGELEAVLSRYEGHKVIFIDACHSGAFHTALDGTPDYSIITGADVEIMKSAKEYTITYSSIDEAAIPIGDLDIKLFDFQLSADRVTYEGVLYMDTLKVDYEGNEYPMMGFILQQGLGLMSGAEHAPADADGDRRVTLRELQAFIEETMAGLEEKYISTPRIWLGRPDAYLDLDLAAAKAQPAEGAQSGAVHAQPFPTFGISGADQCYAILEDGSVWIWGDVQVGTIPGTTATGIAVPTPYQQASGDAVRFANDRQTSYYLRTDGTLYGVSRAHDDLIGEAFVLQTEVKDFDLPLIVLQSGALLLGDNEIFAQGVQRAWRLGGDWQGYGYYLALMDDGSLWHWGNFTSKNWQGDLRLVTEVAQPAQVLDGNVVDVAVSHKMIIVLKADGSVWGWGMNDEGQLGLDETEPRELYDTPQQILPGGAAAVYAYGSEAFVIKDDGSLWHWGYFGRWKGGYLFTEGHEMIIPADVVAFSKGNWALAAVTADGTLYLWGYITDDMTPVPYLTDVAAVQSGAGVILALRRDGTLWSFGGNSKGEMGIGTTDNDADGFRQVLVDTVRSW